ncbi:hypothetical protein BDV12DRAFT_159504 [Aspergillus spectabilis]
MFKKKPTIKNLSPLRSSDRRKIADQVISDYKIEIPSNPPPESSDDPDPDPASPTQPTLTSIRNALLPENCLSARFTTTAGPDLREVQGTVYVGTHTDGEERVLWFRIDQGPGADKRLYPTVYTLWHNPKIVPLLHTPELVMRKLRGGADLMTPGLANEPPFPERAVKGAVVAVASLGRETVPLFVGICEIDVSALGEVQGTKGHAVRGIQWEGDELWAWSPSSRPGVPAPEYLKGWDEEVLGEVKAGEIKAGEIEGGVEELSLEDEGQEAGQEDIEQPAEEQEVEESVVEEKEPTTKEIDDAFENAFLYSLYKLRHDNPSTPNHGLSLPISPSALISNMITPFLPIYTAQQAQSYQIKKTSWKNVKKFIKYLDKQVLVKSKDRNGQETVILDVDFNDRRVLNFTPYRLPNKNAVEGTGKPSNAAGKKPVTTTDGDPSVGQTLTVQALYRPTPKLTPTIFPSLSSTHPGNYYRYSDVSKHLDQYIQSHDPSIVDPQNKRILTLNPFLANTIFSSSSADDRNTLARGKTTRDMLLKRLVEDSNLMAPHYAILKPGQTLSDVKPKAGATPKANVTLERRTGSKTVTKVSNLEIFGIIPNLLAEELQKKCASSTSVSQATGAAKGVMEVLVQGDQRKAIDTALTRRGLKTQWINVVDKTKKK